MPTKYGGRIAAIAIVLFVALFGMPFLSENSNGIFNIFTVFSSKLPWSQKFQLKPGIDIAGGQSLIYEIKLPPGGAPGGLNALAEDVTKSLKKRVDPNGVMNLVWRPQGGRIEIQLPRSAQSGEKEKAQKGYTAAADALKKTNVTADDVNRAVEKLKGAGRDAQLTKLAGGSAPRLATFKDMAAAYDTVVQERAAYAKSQADKDAKAQAQHAEAQARAEIKYDDLKKKLDIDELTPKQLEDILTNPDVAERDKKLADLKEKYKGVPARVEAIQQFVTAFGEYQKYKNSIDDAADLKRMLRGSGVLEFHILVTDQSTPEAAELKKRLEEKGPIMQAGDKMRWYQVDNPEEFKRPTSTYNGKHYVLAWTSPVVGEVGTSEAPRAMVHRQNANPWALVDARAANPTGTSNIVEFRFDTQGGSLFSKLTRENIKQPLAIILDDKVISAPDINSEIGSSGQITSGTQGGFDPAELKYLVNTLKAGSLPAQLAEEPISERNISATFGIDNLNSAVLACGLGLLVVGIFLVSYYYLSGVIALVAVLLNLIIILGVLALFGATFTLPSIAGIVLTVGTAIDANVLIFERLREEQHRGLPIKMAVRNAYDRAFSAIVDSNMTTAIVSFCLYLFGSEEVKGFGLTLLIGILSSMFTALFVTKTIFGLLIDRGHIKNLGSLPSTFPKWDKLLKPDIDWMKYIWPFVGFSAVFLISGLSAFVVKEREMWDVEFASGTAVQFDLKPGPDGRGLPIEAVRKRLAVEANAIPSASVVAVEGTNNRQYEVVTPNDKAKEVREAVIRAMGTDLQVQLPSKFDLAGKDVGAAMNTAVLPIEKETLTVGERTLDTHDYVGGVAIVLRNIDPPISPNDLKNRYDRAAFQAQPGSEASLARLPSEVVRLDNDSSPGAADKPTGELALMVYNQDFKYAKSPGDWQQNLADPVWKAVNDGVGREAQLRNVTSFNPQVAGDVQTQAMLATLCSLVVIMIYIWFRFGNLKYGTATMVALVHDALITIGAIGLSHYVGGTALGRVLLVEPFRINLTLVAAVLTVMGYSMIDTIVVFDRIRENRGKYGHISRKVINDSINQTLSRTLLTCGTTLSMLFLMYIVGGEGIHGFTFVLLVGILVGTYSSIAIAAPILLVGKDEYLGEQVRTTSAAARKTGNRVPVG